MTSQGTKSPIKIFLSYSRKDKEYKEFIEKSLTQLKREELISTWSDRQILPGQQASEKISNAMKETDIVLFLISFDFMHSTPCYEEWRSARDTGKYCIPIIVRNCAWEDFVEGLQVLPLEGKPVESFDSRDEAIKQIYEGVKDVVNEIRRNYTGAEEDVSSSIKHENMQNTTAQTSISHHPAGELKDENPTPTTTEKHSDHEPSGHDMVRDLLLQGDSHLAQGNLEEAKKFFESIITISEHNSDHDRYNMDWQKYIVVAHTSLGLIHMQQWNGAAVREGHNKMLEAIEKLKIYDTSIRWGNMEIVAYISIAGSYRLDGNTAAVIEEYEKIVRIAKEIYARDPFDMEIISHLIFARFSLGNLYFEQGNEQESIEQFQSMSDIAEHWEPQAGVEAPWRFGALAKLYELTSDDKWRMKAIEEGDMLNARGELGTEDQKLLETLRHR